MNYNFLYGPSGSGKTTLAFREMTEASLARPDKHFFVIVPEQYSMQMQKKLLELHPAHASGNIEVMSFNRLAWRVFGELNVRNPEILDDTGKAMILRRVASEHADQLCVWGGRLKKAGFTEHVKSMISELYQYGVTPEQLREAAGSVSRLPLRQKLSDLTLLYENFDRVIKDRALPSEQVLHVFSEVVQDSALLRGAVFLFDSFTGFTPVQYTLIRKLLRIAEQLTFTVTIGREVSPFQPPKEEELFRMSMEMTAKITDLASLEGVSCGEARCLTEPLRFVRNPSLDFLERHFLRYDGAEFRGRPEGISFLLSPDPLREAEKTAEEILRLVKEEGCRYREIAVITADMEGGGAVLRHEFLRQGIPFYMDQNLNVSANPLPELLRSALNCITESYSAGAFLRFLKCSLVPGEMEQKARCENYISAAGIRGYRKMRGPWTYVPNSERDADLQKLNEYKDMVLDLLEPVRDIFSGGGASVGDMVRCLKGLMDAVGAEDLLEQWRSGFEAQYDAEHEREYQRVYEECLRILSEMEELLGDEVLNREDMKGILDTGLNEIRVGQIPAFADRVSVGDLTRTRLGEIRALFLLGANDGLLPSVSQKNSILTDREKMELKELGITLSPTAREDLCTQRYYLYRMVTVPSERLYVSRTEYDRSGKTLRPSGILVHLERLFPEVPAADAAGEDLLLSDVRAERRLIRELRQARQDRISGDLAPLLSAAERAPGGEEKVTRLIDAASYLYEDRLLGRAAARALYGGYLYGSVTRIEEFCSCPQRHFLKYGLKLLERQEYEYTQRNVGTLAHRAIELVFRRAAEQGLLPGAMAEEERSAFVQSCIDEAVRGDESGLYEDSARNRWLVRKLSSIVRKSVAVMSEQMKWGDYRPYAFEEDLGKTGDRPVLSEQLSCGAWMRIGGKADRIDIAEEEDAVALKIVDYKTGSTVWEPYRILSGSQLQLILYLDAATELLSLRFPGKKILPGAVFYNRLDEPWFQRADGTDPGELLKKAVKELRPSGLINMSPRVFRHLCEDPEKAPDILPLKIVRNQLTGSSAATEERFEMLRSYVRRTALKAGEEIYAGRVSAEPLREGQGSACDYCPFSAVCGFDLKSAGFKERINPKISAEEVWAEIAKEMEKEAGEEDQHA